MIELKNIMGGVEYFNKPIKAEAIDKTPFYKNVLNLVYGLSKSGKSYTTAELLLKSSIDNKDVIWLDKDYNVNESMLNMFSNFNHVNENIDLVTEALLEHGGDGEILVFDSLKDFAGNNDLDTNVGAQTAMENIRKYITAGFTVILIAHATKFENGFKIKGNEETIKSKSDVVIKLTSIDGQKIIETTDTRIMNGYREKMIITTDSYLKDKVDGILEVRGAITWTELRQAFPSSLRAELQSVKDIILVFENGKVIGTL